MSNSGMKIGDILHLSPREAFERIQKGTLLVDVRPEFETRYKAFDVPDVRYCPPGMIDTVSENIPRDTEMIVADAVGLRSKEVTLTLLKKGFTKVANLAGGIVEWERDGLPVITDLKEQLSGSCLCRLRPKNKLGE